MITKNMKKFLALMIIFTVLFSPVIALKGVGIKYGIEYTNVGEGKETCLNYGIYNPWDESVVAELTADGELEQFIKKVYSKKIPGGTSSGDAIQVKVCFDIPRKTLDNCEDTKVFEGTVIAREKKENSLGGVGSATSTVVTAPLTLEVVCNEGITGSASASTGNSFKNISLGLIFIFSLAGIVYFMLLNKKKQKRDHPIESHTLREIYMKKYSELMKLHVRIAAGERNPELLRQYNSLREYLELLKEDM
ncbi:hypothetical protein HOH11_03095 [Candidatus Woesearchaeota archaeon]|jgi:hypothetical protein|nr:hypothetical protein [Candidatus Woesearchaeota archaeon]MBT6023557.1 hypothetical protein [Candidatus Woesearchaeota archaeon]